MKVCKHCQNIKDESEFYKNKGAKDNLAYNCKDCAYLLHKIYVEKNREKLIIYRYKYNQNNKQKHREYYLKNKAHFNQLNRKNWQGKGDEYNANRRKPIEIRKQEKRSRYLKNRDHIYGQYRERYKTDIQYKLKVILRSRLVHLIKTRKVGSHIKDLGCSVKDLKNYLESKFQPGMTWDNWSRDGWHIDHIKPLSKFDLSNVDQFRQAIHYTNLQPLWAADNLRKSDKYNE